MNDLFSPHFLKILSGISMGSFSLLAIFGNSCVIIAMIREKRLRTISNLFILSLSISDLLIGLFVMPMSATLILFEKWIWGFWVCQSWLTIDYIASTASIFNLLFLSIDRLWSIVEPLRYISHISKTRSNITIISIWFVSSLWLIPINFWPHQLDHTSSLNISNERFDCETDFETDKSFKIITTIFNFYVPLIGMLFIYTKIFHSIKSRSKSELISSCLTANINVYKSASTSREAKSYLDLSEVSYRTEEISNSKEYQPQKSSFPPLAVKPCKKKHSYNYTRRNGLNKSHIIETLPDKRSSANPCTSEPDKIPQTVKCNLLAKFFNKTTQNVKPTFSPGLKQQIKAARQLGILLLAFLVFWLPYSIMFLVVAFCSDCISNEVSMLCVWLGYINSAVNPILYPLCNSEFRAAFRKMFRISPSEPTRRDIINVLYSNKK